MKSFTEFLQEKMWSADVETKWSPPEGLFKKSGEEIAKTLLDAGKNKAMKRLMFYINRAGKGLPEDEKGSLNKAKEIISKATE